MIRVYFFDFPIKHIMLNMCDFFFQNIDKYFDDWHLPLKLQLWLNKGQLGLCACWFSPLNMLLFLMHKISNVKDLFLNREGKKQMTLKRIQRKYLHILNIIFPLFYTHFLRISKIVQSPDVLNFVEKMRLDCSFVLRILGKN